jgi:hypothetical protein
LALRRTWVLPVTPGYCGHSPVPPTTAHGALCGAAAFGAVRPAAARSCRCGTTPAPHGTLGTHGYSTGRALAHIGHADARGRKRGRSKCHAQIAPTVPTYDAMSAVCVHRSVACARTRTLRARTRKRPRAHAQTRMQTCTAYIHTHTHSHTHNNNNHNSNYPHNMHYTHTYTLTHTHAHARTHGCSCVRRPPHPRDGVGVRRGLAVPFRLVLRRPPARHIGRCGAPSARPVGATPYLL